MPRKAASNSFSPKRGKTGCLCARAHNLEDLGVPDCAPAVPNRGRAVDRSSFPLASLRLCARNGLGLFPTAAQRSDDGPRVRGFRREARIAICPNRFSRPPSPSLWRAKPASLKAPRRRGIGVFSCPQHVSLQAGKSLPSTTRRPPSAVCRPWPGLSAGIRPRRRGP